MDPVLLKILSFVLAIGVLVAVHEFGHFWVARKLGVKVLRFSIGFGKPLFGWTGKQDQTEYVIAAIPLGGYVKMLDEREGWVDPDEAHRAFNRQSLKVRSAVVVAGPLFNFLFAIAAFWAVFMLGETGLRPLVGEVEQNSIAAQAGLRSGDEILAVDDVQTPTWNLVIQQLAAASVDRSVLTIQVLDSDGVEQQRRLDAALLGDLAEVPDLMGKLGMQPERPTVPPVFGEVLEGEAAAQAGILPDDEIVQADGQQFAEWYDWVKFVQARPQQTIELQLRRAGRLVDITLTPGLKRDGDREYGFIGATNRPVPGAAERYRVEYSLPPLQAFVEAASRTAEFSLLTLKVMWQMLSGEASIQNLSGPFSIADAAGKTASYGLVYFLKFLAVVSISLGVLNLLPVPILDGGHLVYFALEGLRGSPLPESWLLNGQKIGMLLLAALMGIAFYVDIQRFFG